MLLLLFAGAVVQLLRIRADLEGGREALAGLSLERLDGGLVATIDRATDRLDRAERTADGILLAPLRFVPLLGDQVNALRDLTDVAADVGSTGRAAAVAIEDDLERAATEPSARIDLLGTLAEQLDIIEDQVVDIEVGAGGNLIAPLQDARDELEHELERVPERFAEARGYISALTRLLTGPTRYLVLAANNAEMRGGGGMPLSGGVITFENGDVTFGAFAQLANRHVAGVPELLPEPWGQTYREFKMGVSWLQTAVSPNFPVTAPIYAAMSGQFPLGPVDGVIQVDAIALSALLEVMGPVRVGDRSYNAANIAFEILYQDYLDFPVLDVRDDRRNLQGQLAQVIFNALKTRDVEVAELASGLRKAAEGRHLIAWSADSGVQELWDSFGATGEMPEDSLMVTVQNIAANKLDFFIDPRVTINAFPQIGTDDWKVRLTTTIENPDLDDDATNGYIDGDFGPYPDALHRALVAVYLPASAYDVRTLDEEFTEFGGDPPVQMYGKRVLIPRGETTAVALEFSMPKDEAGALLLPAGRIQPMDVEVNGVKGDDSVATQITWGEPPEAERTPGAAAVAGVLSLAGALAVLIGVRPRLRVAGRPMRAVPELVLRAPSFGAVLFLAALGALVAGALISAAS